MKYYYRAVTQNGKQVRGLIESRDVNEAAHYLKKHKLTPITITPPENLSLKRFFPFFFKPSRKDLIFFTRQLSSMLTSGLTLMQSLVIIKEQMKRSDLSDIVDSVVLDVQNGASFSSAITKYPSFFPEIYVSLVKAGEGSGLLDTVLTRLADNLEKQQKLQQEIRGALLYPIIVVIMMIIVMMIMFIFVIPQLDTLYSNLQMSLPIQTVIVVKISEFVRVSWFFLAGLLFLAIFLFRIWYRNPQGKHIIDAYFLKIPLFGKLLSQSMLAEFTRTFGLLIGSGELVVDSLLKSSDVIGNVVYQDAIKLVAHRVEKGISVSDALSTTTIGQPFLIQMTKIGEQTGKLDDSLQKASEYYEREVSQTVKTLMTLMEPIIMAILGLGVGFLIFAIITPIYNLLSGL